MNYKFVALSKFIADETNPDVLKMYLGHTLGIVEQQERELKNLRAEKAKADQQRLNLDDQLVAMRKRHFAKSFRETKDRQ